MDASQVPSFGGVSFEKRLPDLPHGTYVVSLIETRIQCTNKGPGTPDNIGQLTSVLIEGQESDGPHGYRIQISGLKYPSYAARDLKKLTAAILGYDEKDPRAIALDRPDLNKIMENPAAHKGARFVVTVRQGNQKPQKAGRPIEFYPEVDCRALVPGETLTPPDRAQAQAQTSTAPTAAQAPAQAAQVASRKPAPPALPQVNDGGPWFDFDAPDPRAGVEQYNERGETRAKV